MSSSAANRPSPTPLEALQLAMREAMAGYLRTCQSGGMLAKQARQVQGALDDMLSRPYLPLAMVEQGLRLSFAAVGKARPVSAPEDAVLELARASGATNEEGGRAEGVFCFTTAELLTFAARVAASQDTSLQG